MDLESREHSSLLSEPHKLQDYLQHIEWSPQLNLLNLYEESSGSLPEVVTLEPAIQKGAFLEIDPFHYDRKFR